MLYVLLLFMCVFWQPFDLVCALVYYAAFLHSWLSVFLGICVNSVSVLSERSTVCYCIKNTAQCFHLLCFYSGYNWLHNLSLFGFFHSISGTLMCLR